MKKLIVEMVERITRKRASIVIDDDLDQKIRTIQAAEIEKKLKVVTYSEVINNLLRKSLS